MTRSAALRSRIASVALRRALNRLGVQGRSLGMAGSRNGAWAIARHWVLQQALNNRTLRRHGFTLPWETATTPVVL